MEYNVVQQVKTYWNKSTFLSDIGKEEFTDANSENSVRTAKFLEVLDLGPILPEINKHYNVKEGKETYPRRAMTRVVILRKIKEIKYFTDMEKHLKTYPDEALELGFNIDMNGNPIVPDHETLRHFEKVRLGNEGMDAIMDALCIQVVKAGDKLGLKIGENTGTDSTPIEVPHDPDGTYNGHYKKIMVKAHITEDYDHHIPLAKKVCGGTDGDDQYLEWLLRKTAMSCKHNMKETWYDGGYNSNKNIALSYIEFYVIAHYKINIDWRENVTYEHSFNGQTYSFTPEQEVNNLYRKLWKESDYKEDASLEYIMQCLVKRGIYEPVAMHFRNARIREYEECPEGVLELYHRRNNSEGINSYMKGQLGLETCINGKRMKNIDLHVTECCIALLAVALIRLQHGIKENLTSVAYLT